MKNLIIVIIAAVAIIGIVWGVVSAKNNRAEDAAMLTPGEVTVTGTTGCLPKKDTGGPVTMECALGLLDADGQNYGLDTSAVQDEIGTILAGNTTITVTGNFVPLQTLSSDRWYTYDIAGIIQVASFTVGNGQVVFAGDATQLAWKCADMGMTQEGNVPSTGVSLAATSGTTNQEFPLGVFEGTCSDANIQTPGFVSGKTIYFAGYGEELAVFNENNRLVVKKRIIEEGTAEGDGFISEFETVMTLP